MVENVSSVNPKEIMDIKNQPAVETHVNMMQSIISRLAENSAKCKEWCFALVGALIVFILSRENNNQVGFEVVYYITGIFAILDAYYLGLERNMRSKYKKFIEKINKGEDISKNIFLPSGIDKETSLLKKFLKKMGLHFIWTLWGIISYSILIPYGLITVTAIILAPN